MVKEVPEYPAPPRVVASGTGTTDVISTDPSTNHGEAVAPARLSSHEGIEGESKNADQRQAPTITGEGAASRNDVRIATTGKGATSSRTDQAPMQNAASAAEGPRVPLTNRAVDPTLPKPPVSEKSAEILQSRKKRAPSG